MTLNFACAVYIYTIVWRFIHIDLFIYGISHFCFAYDFLISLSLSLQWNIFIRCIDIYGAAKLQLNTIFSYRNKQLIKINKTESHERFIDVSSSNIDVTSDTLTLHIHTQ